MVTGSLIASRTAFETSTVALNVFGVRFTASAAVTALLVNLVVATVLTPVLNAFKAPRGADVTSGDDYEVEAAPPIEEPAEPEPAGARR
jgi:hypothetical protein